MKLCNRGEKNEFANRILTFEDKICKSLANDLHSLFRKELSDEEELLKDIKSTAQIEID